MEDKNIDKLFQEKLANLVAIPNKKVWTGIEQKLTKKKRRVAPFWWFSSGIAALFLIGFFLLPNSKTPENSIKNNVVITNKPKTKTPENNINLDTILNKNSKEVLIANDENKQPKKSKEKKNITKNSVLVANNTIDFQQKKKKEKELANYLKSEETKKQNNFINTKKKDAVNDKTFLEEIKKPKKNLFTVTKENKEKIENASKKKESTWSINPVFAVLQSNSFTNTSSISTNLSNTTNGNNSFAYGIQFAYKINKKWSIQSGIHQQKTSYQNNNIIVTNANLNADNVVAFSRGNSFDFINNSTNRNLAADLSIDNNAVTSGNLIQEFGYIEIPLEIKYNIFSSQKFNTQVVTGFSSLFLNTNSIRLNTNTFNDIGTAKNLNTINFSGNFGVDFNYLLNKNWSLHLNPMFKAQLNTFSENANGFAPFNVGIYSGVKYNF